MTTGPLIALLAAALFGASTPLTKLLGGIDPLILAGLLYLGSGLGLSIVRLTRPRAAPLPRQDWPWLAGAIICGGIVGPICLVLGLRATPASTASLLLNLEGVLTAMLAWVVFGEAADRRIVAGMIAIVAGGVVLGWSPSAGVAFSAGALLIAVACLAWALDNNLLQRVSGGDALQIASLKGLVAGGVTISIGLMLGQRLPALPSIGAAALVGLLGYGASLVLYVIALRQLGTARTGAYYAAAPFIGVGLSVLLLGETLTTPVIVAALLMALGLYLHLTEDHGHDHDHPTIEHTHPHQHDTHHSHEHEPAVALAPGTSHSHRHAHATLLHRHPHYPDLHHRHRHEQTADADLPSPSS